MPDRARLRVLDLTDELAFQGARLLVGLGAEVLRVDDGGPLGAAAAAHWHAGKRRLPGGDLDELAAGADVVLESGPLRELRGIRPDGSSRWPDAVHVVVTPFGLTGPRRHWLAGDLVLASAGGMSWLGGRADGPPKPPPREQAVQLAGAHAAIAALLGVLAADRIGTGQLVDISAQEAVAATLETAAISWIHSGRFPVRNGGVYEHVAHRIFAAADGHVAGGYSGSNRMWTDLLAWMVEEGEAGELVDERYADPVTRWRARPTVDEIVARFAAKRTASALAEQARARALPWAEVVPPARLTENPQLLARDFFARVTGEALPEAGALNTGFPWNAPGRPRPVTLHPLRETHTPWHSTHPRGRRAVAAPGLPGGPGLSGVRALGGVRVLDLTWVLAGPYATKVLAEHGAEIVKVESRHRQDPTRFAPSMRLRPDGGPDSSGYFVNFNRGKRGVALNLRTERGQGLLRELAARCDVVVENFSPGVLARWGLDYPSLRAANPDVILLSMAGVGQTGPWRDAVTFADTLAGMSGLSSETRDPGGPPQGLTFGLGDMVAANAGVLGVLDLLAAGRGGLVDLSQLEAMAATMGPAVLEAALPDGERDQRTAEHPNRSTRACPHGIYPAAGEDRWVAIAVRTDEQWSALAELAGLDLPRHSGLAARRADEDRIDAALAAWTATEDAATTAERLQAAGVPAAPVATGRDLVEADEQLAARGFYPTLTHPLIGPVRHEGVVARLSATPGRLDAPAPLLGEHTRDVLRELLGLDERELTELTEAGVLE
ncbi:CoA transferase [Pseudonocardia eucalypti]|uniref:CoA transferase n=1 Tax=Pseudonocardia eucalypti TaxID=648755 RepID=A0ABP9RF04_9PSEU|nr:crotonobetainyl-CoA:carnitine CoA-transferase CaiB-like acyl-CoA transferase [Pseudonocardia eucalypti]